MVSYLVGAGVFGVGVMNDHALMCFEVQVAQDSASEALQ